MPRRTADFCTVREETRVPQSRFWDLGVLHVPYSLTGMRGRSNLQPKFQPESLALLKAFEEDFDCVRDDRICVGLFLLVSPN